MKIKLPVTWEVCGWVEVDAPDLASAIKNFDPDMVHLPKDSEYVDGSFRLSSVDPDEVQAMTSEESSNPLDSFRFVDEKHA